MTTLVHRYFLHSPTRRPELADLIVFISTTGLCALGALALPLVG